MFAIDKERLIRKAETLEADKMNEADEAIKVSLQLNRG